jgi:putative ABC transport system substrate-binding protein
MLREGQLDRRRAITALAVLGGLTACRSSWAQPRERSVARIGFLFAGTLANRPQAQGFWDGLHELGYMSGKNVLIEVREAQGKVERLPELAKELVAWKPDVIVAVTPVAITAAQRATSSIPIVMAITVDPARYGHLQNLARPEGNITGPVLRFERGSAGKGLQLFKELLPKVSKMGVLWNAKNKVQSLNIMEHLEASASELGVQLQSLPVDGSDGLESALAASVRHRAQALYIVGDPVLSDKRAVIISFAAANRLPAAYSFTDEVLEGGLFAYGWNLRTEYRKSAPYVDKLLKGAKPSDLPVEQTTKYEIAINLKTAKALGISVPQSLLLRADRVIE